MCTTAREKEKYTVSNAKKRANAEGEKIVEELESEKVGKNQQIYGNMF